MSSIRLFAETVVKAIKSTDKSVNYA
jgi:hypothetical protein